MSGTTESHAQLILSPTEQALVSLSRRGLRCSVIGSEDTRVRAEVLRSLLVGSLPAENGVATIPTLVDLSGAEVQGCLDLSDLGSPDRLPPLIFRHCVISDLIYCDQGNFSRIALESSRFVGLSLNHSTVAGNLRVDGCEAHSASGCRISAIEAVLGGVTILNTHFQSGARPALDFQDCNIAGSFSLLGDVEVRGTLRLNGARVSGQFALSDTRLACDPMTADITRSLSADSAVIGGNVFMDCAHAKGGVSFEGSKIGGSFSADGASFDGLGLGPAFTVAAAEIGGDLTGAVFCTDSQTKRFQAKGSFVLLNARIDGDLDLRGASLTADDGDVALNGSGASIGHELILRAARLGEHSQEVVRFSAEGALQFINAEIGNNVELRGAEVVCIDRSDAISFDGSRIGGAVHFCASPSSSSSASDDPFVRTEIYGTVHMRRCHVDDLVCFIGTLIAPPPSGKGIELSGAEIGDDLRIGGEWRPASTDGGPIPFQSFGEISLHGARVGGAVWGVGGAITTSPLSIALNLQRAEVRGGVILRSERRIVSGTPHDLRYSARGSTWMLGATIGGNCDLGGGYFEGGTFGSINLQNARIGENLRLNGRRETAFVTEIVGTINGAFMSTDGQINLRDIRLRNSPGSVNNLSFESASCRELSFDPATIAVSESYTLKLDGLQYDSVECTPASHPAVRGLPYLLLMMLWPLRRPLLRLHARETLGLGSRAARLAGECTKFDPRWRWYAYILRLTFKDHPSQEEYSPQPFAQMAKALHRSGDFESERLLLSFRNRIETRFLPYTERAAMRLYGLCFDYGLSQWRAVASLLACLLIGTIGVEVALRSEPQFAGMSTQSGAMPNLRSILVRELTPPLENGPASAAKESEVPCGEQIEPALYAADVFIPLIDLRQEQRCTISSRPDAWGWRWAKALYALIGWLIVSLSIFTIGGFARRRAAADPS